MLKSLLCNHQNQFSVVEDPSAISDLLERHDHLMWLDLEQPTLEEFRLIQEEFNLHPLAIEDAMARHQRPKVDQYDNYYLVVFYAVALESGESGLRMPGRYGLEGTRFPRTGDSLPGSSIEGHRETGQTKDQQTADKGQDAGTGEQCIVLRELTMFMGQNYLITVHKEPVPELAEAAKRWRRNVETITAEKEGTGIQAPGTRSLTLGEDDRLKNSDKSPGGAQSLTGDKNENGKGPSNGTAPVGSKTSGQETAPAQVGQAGPHTGGIQSTNSIGILLYSLIDTIVDDYFPVVDSIVERIEDLEEQIFERYNQQAIESIFSLKKDLLALRKVLAPERDVLNVLTRRDIPIFEQNTLVYFQDIYDHVVRITDSIDTYRDLLSSALDSFLSMQSNRLNITVQTLTSVSIMLMSVSTITGWYGMNFENMPELKTAYGYPIVILTVILIVGIEAFFFHRKKWL
ncbi:MAG: magnesium transporter CorA family protein [Chloroflexota bacterium]|nr:magnesium transporter CorA family protein [Chloroflexota bacterium]